MRYSDENQQGLMSLLAASQKGLDPTTAYGMLQDIQGDQEAQLAQRKERQAGLIGMLMEQAQGGMPYAGAEAMLEAAPGPMGPALQSALEALYPGGGPLPTNANGEIMDMPMGSRPTDPATGMANPYSGLTTLPGGGYGDVPVNPATGPEATSPAYQPAPPSFSDQQAMMEMEQQQTLQADLTAAQADAAAARAEQWTVDDWIAKSQGENPEMWATAPEEMMAIAQNTFGEAAVGMRGVAAP